MSRLTNYPDKFFSQIHNTVKLTNKILTVKSNDAEDEDERQNQDNDGVDLEPWGLVGVEAEHGAARAAGAGCARAARPHIGELLLLVSGRPAADDVTGSSGRRGGGWATGGRAGGRADWGGGARRRLFFLQWLA